ncbi:MAG TPA: DUF1990 domain-containing protein [Streptosporangiaceae bacterium]|nr:DUF1990 domain-containing protein [Streptosporangiaceae bacterium]
MTYDDVGATAGTLPSGYHHLRVSRLVGSGADAFVAATAALFSWQVHLHAGLRVTASAAVAAPGIAVLLGIGAGPARIRAACRVVYTVNESARQGFAYGTLPGHPESGEEVFIIEHRDDDGVVFTITAFSRPATAATRAAGPIGRRVQQYITSRYLGALAAILRAETAAN